MAVGGSRIDNGGAGHVRAALSRRALLNQIDEGERVILHLVVQNKGQTVRSNDRIPPETGVPVACAEQQKKHKPGSAARGRRTPAARSKRGANAREGSRSPSARGAVAGIERRRMRLAYFAHDLSTSAAARRTPLSTVVA
nr:hypothetical protein [Pandoravirus aubagnensis]